ncbi:MAG: hypothetical protein EP334_10100 [Gammaproteobacteria bacterium]|nr:MAG: hypothetical protein EP334_10100 [Gammaproteobacteria bacterium]
MTTPILAIPELAAGQATPYAVANAMGRALEAAANDFLTVDLSSGNVALTAAQYRGYVLFRSSGNTVARDLTLQAIKRLVVVENGGTAVLSVKLSTTTVTVSPGERKQLFTDGTATGLVALGGGLFNKLNATTAPSATDDSSAGYSVGSLWVDTTNDAAYICVDSTATAAVWLNIHETPTESFIVACSDLSTEVTTGTGKGVFFMPYAFVVTEVIGAANSTPTGSALTMDINEDGVSILSTKITIDDGESTSLTAATPPVISDASIAKGAKVTVDFDGVGSTFGGAGVQAIIVGRKA